MSLQSSEQAVATLEEEKKHLDFMASVRQYDSADSNQDEDGNNRDKSHRDQDPVVDLFPDDDQEERGNYNYNFYSQNVFVYYYFLSNITIICNSLFRYNVSYSTFPVC